ncbi:dimethylargininase [Pseudomonas duriflava]|uniref:Dimethylargininase n=1 Tax=Pseudomonas duriflava TaxID=459528 RepID=A0A562Q8U8_9PSED|nr:arginine deiminase-related protein [Pseudomonas duriflava]TWI52456.1 dimethylargininase [Pseudomonas duriflava]
MTTTSVSLALVRPPVSRLAEGVVDNIERQPVDVALAERQWNKYVAALREAGWPVQVVEASERHPDSVFIEDTVVLYRGLAVITNLGHPSRQGES